MWFFMSQKKITWTLSLYADIHRGNLNLTFWHFVIRGCGKVLEIDLICLIIDLDLCHIELWKWLALNDNVSFILVLWTIKLYFNHIWWLAMDANLSFILVLWTITLYLNHTHIIIIILLLLIIMLMYMHLWTDVCASTSAELFKKCWSKG